MCNDVGSRRRPEQGLDGGDCQGRSAPIRQLLIVGALLCCCGVDGATVSQVSTVAGGGRGAQDGIGTSATFNQPRKLAVSHGETLRASSTL